MIPIAHSHWSSEQRKNSVKHGGCASVSLVPWRVMSECHWITTSHQWTRRTRCGIETASWLTVKEFIGREESPFLQSVDITEMMLRHLWFMIWTHIMIRHQYDEWNRCFSAASCLMLTVLPGQVQSSAPDRVVLPCTGWLPFFFECHSNKLEYELLGYGRMLDCNWFTMVEG